MRVLSQELAIALEAFRNEIRQYTSPDGYDLFAHLQAHGHDPQALKALLTSHLQGQQFLFPDAPPRIKKWQNEPETNLVIVTVGTPEYQNFKLKLCPELDGLPRYIIGFNKGHWLAKQWANNTIHFDGADYNEALVVDDKASTFTPLAQAPANVRLMHILRPDAAYPQISPLKRVEVVSGLATI